MNQRYRLGNVGVLMCFKMAVMVRNSEFIIRLSKIVLVTLEAGNAPFVEM